MNVLVFPCGSEIGLEVFSCLNNIRNINLIGASSVADHGRFVYKTHYHLPFITSENFLEELNKLVSQENIDFIYPAHDEVIVQLAKNKPVCPVIGCSAEVCCLLRSKKKTYEYFCNYIRTPAINVVQFPVFLKPEIGQGGKGTHIAYNQQELDFYLSKNPSLLVLEYLPGEEFTIDCFTNYLGELLYCSARQRVRITNGISNNTALVEIPELKEIARIINDKIVLNGAWFFQVKRSATGEFGLLEIAPRISGSSALSRMNGVNLPLLSIYNQMKQTVSLLDGKFVTELDRSLANKYRFDFAFKHLYIDLDDCIIINGKLNSEAVKLIVECLNRDIKIHLLTKHSNDLEKTLKSFRISDLFDEKIQISREDEKWRYIKEKDAIMVDDSFAERLAIQQHLQIPVFGVEAMDFDLEIGNEVANLT